MSILKNIRNKVAGEIRAEVDAASSRIGGILGASSGASASFGRETLRYPLKWDPTDPHSDRTAYWLKVEVNKARSKDDPTFDRIEQKVLDQTIWMYLPSMQQADSMNYETPDIGFRGAAARDLVQSGKDLGSVAASFGAGVADDAASTVQALVGGGQPSLGAIATATSLAKSVPGIGGAASAVERGLGVTKNPHTIALFQGVNLRTHKFEFIFVPTSAEEAAEVEKIVRAFRTYMYPQSITAREAFARDQGGAEAANVSQESLDTNLAYIFPNTFKLTAMRWDEDGGFVDLSKQGVFYKECALTACSVDFDPEKKLAVMKGGFFPSTTMSLDFTELETIDRSDMENT